MALPALLRAKAVPTVSLIDQAPSEDREVLLACSSQEQNQQHNQCWTILSSLTSDQPGLTRQKSIGDITSSMCGMHSAPEDGMNPADRGLAATATALSPMQEKWWGRSDAGVSWVVKF
jgi:hypothetical protein